MYMYVTSGTHHFMQNLWLKHKPAVQIFQNNNESILVHETEKKTVFASPRKYETVYSVGEISNDHLLSLDSFYVDKSDRPLFIERFHAHVDEIFKPNYMIGLRLLKPINTDNFCVVTSWRGQMEDPFDINSLVGKSHANIFVSRTFSKKYFPIEVD